MEIDKILVKSISRFARNTMECLETIRELKALGISVFFEEHNIDTKMVSSEMLTAVIAACAQAESESISQNMRWSYQKRMVSGKFITCKAPFGYRLINNNLVIEPREAAIVQEIYSLFLSGWSTTEIASKVIKAGIRLQEGTERWGVRAVQYILQNEKYIGDALLQKRYSTESFPRERKYNHGEQLMYYVEENINTLETDTELIITFMSAFAQSESESISANVRWGIRQAMKEGKVHVNFNRLYGYTVGEDGEPEIVPEQAEAIRLIFDRYLLGDSLRDIKEYLEVKGIPAPDGGMTWDTSRISGILKNEKYAGDVLLQKTFKADVMSGKTVKNTGQLPM